MVIKDKADHDPVANLYAVDAYMRWALQASEEVIGDKGMHIVLREAGLEQLIGNYPPNSLEASGNFTFGDYANLCAALLNFFGRPGKSMTMRIGRLSAKLSVEQQSATFGLGALVKASRLLPLVAQQKAGLAVMLMIASALAISSLARPLRSPPNKTAQRSPWPIRRHSSAPASSALITGVDNSRRRAVAAATYWQSPIASSRV